MTTHTNTTTIGRHIAALTAVAALTTSASALAATADLRSEAARDAGPVPVERASTWADVRTEAARDPRGAAVAGVPTHRPAADSGWDDAAMGAAGGALIVLVLAGSTVLVTRPRRRTAS